MTEDVPVMHQVLVLLRVAAAQQFVEDGLGDFLRERARAHLIADEGDVFEAHR